jgi:hypothetical protein
MKVNELETRPLNLAVLVHQEGGSAGISPLKDGSGLWASHSWAINQNKYQQLIGGTFSVHEKQNLSSHFGGEIVQVIPDQKEPSRSVIIFKPSTEIKNGSISGKSFNWGHQAEKVYY